MDVNQELKSNNQNTWYFFYRQLSVPKGCPRNFHFSSLPPGRRALRQRKKEQNSTINKNISTLDLH